jgi:hypothetical protein
MKSRSIWTFKNALLRTLNDGEETDPIRHAEVLKSADSVQEPFSLTRAWPNVVLSRSRRGTLRLLTS